MVKFKGRLLYVQQMETTWEDPIIFVPLNWYVLHLLDFYDIYLKIEKIFISVHWSHFISYFILKYIRTIHKYHRSLTSLPYRSMYGGSFTKLTIWYLTVSGVTWGHHLYFGKENPMCVPHLSFYLAFLHCQRACSVPQWSFLGTM